MRAVVQRVTTASITADNRPRGAIGRGLVILLGVGKGDTPEDATWLAERITRLKWFDDASGRPALDIREADAELAAVSQFTLFASTRKGTRPSWHRAAPPDTGQALYHDFIAKLSRTADRPVLEGVFGARMQVALENEGPVTLILDSKARE